MNAMHIRHRGSSVQSNDAEGAEKSPSNSMLMTAAPLLKGALGLCFGAQFMQLAV